MNHGSPVRVALDALRVRACVGLTEEERKRPQNLLCTCTVVLPADYRPEHDTIKNTVDYGELARRIRAVAARTEVKLLERLAWDLGTDVIDVFPAAATVTISLTKSGRVPRCDGARVEVTVSRQDSSRRPQSTADRDPR
ncbi:MAG: FolB domain-containing protein [Spirochaetaceae bacterium]|nr:MAG: FolB domain-containing protein [Spirochaetaceae bacterium]